MIRVWLLKWCQNNQDHDLTSLLYAMIASHWVIMWLEVSTNQVGVWFGFILVTRTGWQTFLVRVENDANYTIDTSGNKKVRIQLDQSKINDWSTINSTHSNVATINTGASRPSTAHLKLAEITAWSIVDAREVPQMRFWLSKEWSYAETIKWVKTFASHPLKQWSGTDLNPTSLAEYCTKYYVDNKPVNVPDASTGTKGIQFIATDTDADNGTNTTKSVNPKQNAITINWSYQENTVTNTNTGEVIWSSFQTVKRTIIMLEMWWSQYYWTWVLQTSTDWSTRTDLYSMGANSSTGASLRLTFMSKPGNYYRWVARLSAVWSFTSSTVRCIYTS